MGCAWSLGDTKAWEALPRSAEDRRAGRLGAAGGWSRCRDRGAVLANVFSHRVAPDVQSTTLPGYVNMPHTHTHAHAELCLQERSIFHINHRIYLIQIKHETRIMFGPYQVAITFFFLKKNSTFLSTLWQSNKAQVTSRLPRRQSQQPPERERDTGRRSGRGAGRGACTGGGDQASRARPGHSTLSALGVFGVFGMVSFPRKEGRRSFSFRRQPRRRRAVGGGSHGPRGRPRPRPLEAARWSAGSRPARQPRSS